MLSRRSVARAVRPQGLTAAQRPGTITGMTAYLISFPSEAMVLTADELPVVGAAASAVVDEAKAAGVYLFAGGINEEVEPVLVSADGTASAEIYPGSRVKGGFTVLELPSREAALEWAQRFAVACRCAQEVREFA
jgi:hypothetical protein